MPLEPWALFAAVLPLVLPVRCTLTDVAPGEPIHNFAPELGGWICVALGLVAVVRAVRARPRSRLRAGFAALVIAAGGGAVALGFSAPGRLAPAPPDDHPDARPLVERTLAYFAAGDADGLSADLHPQLRALLTPRVVQRFVAETDQLLGRYGKVESLEATWSGQVVTAKGTARFAKAVTTYSFGFLVASEHAQIVSLKIDIPPSLRAPHDDASALAAAHEVLDALTRGDVDRVVAMLAPTVDPGDVDRAALAAVDDRGRPGQHVVEAEPCDARGRAALPLDEPGAPPHHCYRATTTRGGTTVTVHLALTMGLARWWLIAIASGDATPP